MFKKINTKYLIIYKFTIFSYLIENCGSNYISTTLTIYNHLDTLFIKKNKKNKFDHWIELKF